MKHVYVLSAIAGMLLGLCILAVVLPHPAAAQGPFVGPVPIVDPCVNPATVKSSASISVASATTTQLVALAAGKAIFVCGYSATINSSATTASTIVFEYGTGSSCGTGTTVLTGAMGTENAAAGAGILLTNGYPGTIFTAPTGNALCVLTAGTTVALHGYITYVQQ